MPCQSRLALAPALPSPVLQLKGPELPKILIQTEILVKGQNTKNSLSNSKYFGTQIQKLCQESDKRKDMLILLFLTLLFPAGKTQALLLPHLYGGTFHFGDNYPSVPSRNKREINHGNHRRIQ